MKGDPNMKQYNVVLSNDSCIFDSFDGFDTIDEAIEFAIGRGGRYVIQLDAGNAEAWESIRITYDCETKTFSHYDGWEWVNIKPEEIKKYINRYI